MSIKEHEKTVENIDEELKKVGVYIAKLLALPGKQRTDVYTKIEEVEDKIKDGADSAYMRI